MVRHGDDPCDDRIVTFLEQNGAVFEIRKPFKGEALGDVDESVAGTIFYGVPFVVTETRRYPFLLEEARWIEACMREGVPVLGICQGAQSIVYLLGAKLGPLPGEPHEFGYYPIYATEQGHKYLPEVMHVTESHFHGFDLPHGAELLATGDMVPHQAFKYGELTFSFQFHAEVTIDRFQRWQKADRVHNGKPGAQTGAEQDALAKEHDAGQHEWLMDFLAMLFDDQRIAADPELKPQSFESRASARR